MKVYTSKELKRMSVKELVKIIVENSMSTNKWSRQLEKVILNILSEREAAEYIRMNQNTEEKEWDWIIVLLRILEGVNYMAEIGNVVRLTDDVYYGTNKEKDHVFITNIYDGKFDGIGITEHQKFIGCNLENWQETNEKLFTNAGNKILLTKKHEGVYNIDIENIGYIGFGFVKELQTMISKLIINEYARIYS